MGFRYTVVDAFSEVPFRGNPAAVYLLQEPADEKWMMVVAREMNLDVTAFLYPEARGYRLRWFTPKMEDELCGHATLASAHVLWEEGHLSKDQAASFETRSGPLTVHLRGDLLWLNLPAEPAKPERLPKGMAEALGVKPKWTGKNRLDHLVEVGSEDEVRSLDPDFGTMFSPTARGVVVTARASGGFDFVSRYFAPWTGTDEDHATGSTHCALGPYWGERLGKSMFRAFQASQRGGVIDVENRDSRVMVGGRAVTVLKGELLHGPPL